jgi:hypothetical protein
MDINTMAKVCLIAGLILTALGSVGWLVCLYVEARETKAGDDPLIQEPIDELMHCVDVCACTEKCPKLQDKEIL